MDILDQALSNIPKKFRSKILSSYLEVKRRFARAKYDGSWDSSGLSAGKFCESVLRFLQYELTGSFIDFGKHIPNFVDQCQRLISLPKTNGIESLRIIIPRALVFLYTIRGKRGIGHVGGDVDANQVDTATVVRICDWIFCELIRIYHNLSLEEAQDLVDSINYKNLPDIWEVAGRKRVLNTNLTYKEKTLLLAYTELQNGILTEDIFSWCEYYDLRAYKQKILKPLHSARLIEYDKENEIVFLSPLGIKEVEEKILVKNKS